MRAIAALLCVLLVAPVHGESLMPINLAAPGPGALLYMPVDLIKKIGADQAEGVALAVRHFGGGPLAFKEMMEGNVDFAVAGALALAGLKVQGDPVVSIATVNHVPAYVLMVRSDLKGKVKKIADLKGRVIGVNTSAKSKSASQLAIEFLLRQAGVKLNQVNFVPAGQSLEYQTAAFSTRAVDAIMGDEPFASQLKAQGKAFTLADLSGLETTRATLGGLFLSAQLSTRADVIREQPTKAERMVRVMQRTLQWIASHSAEEIVAKLEIPDAQSRSVLTQVLKRHKDMFSTDGSFTEEQVRTAERFFQSSDPANPAVANFQFRSMIDPRWVGMKAR